MSQALWTKIDDYYTHLFVPPDPALDAALAASDAAGLPQIAVAPNQGKLTNKAGILPKTPRAIP